MDMDKALDIFMAVLAAIMIFILGIAIGAGIKNETQTFTFKDVPKGAIVRIEEAAYEGAAH